MCQKPILIFSFSLLLLLLPSCNAQMGIPPFVLTIPECVIGAVAPFQSFAGIHFTVHNTSQQTIQTIIVSCMVYKDTEGTNPFIGSNQIIVQFDTTIRSSQSRKLVICLDPYIYTVPHNKYIIDFFYISSVTFSDGTNWTDPFGTYYVRSNQ